MLWVYEIDEKLKEFSQLREKLQAKDDVCSVEYLAHIERLRLAYIKELSKAQKRKQPEHAEKIRYHKYDSLVEREIKWRHYLNM